MGCRRDKLEQVVMASGGGGLGMVELGNITS